jgi:hypothetical protein
MAVARRGETERGAEREVMGDARDRPVAVKLHVDGRWLAHDDARRFHRNQRPVHGWQDGHVDVADDNGRRARTEQAERDRHDRWDGNRRGDERA